MSDFAKGLLIDSEAPEWLTPLRDAGRARWTDTERPTRRTEDWKYTSLHLLDREFTAAPSPQSTDISALPDLGGPRIVLIDGQLQGSVADLELPQGVTLLRFADADDDQAALIREHLGTAVDGGKHVFANLNDATLSDGLFLHLAANADMPEALHIVYVSSAQEPAFTVNQRLLVLADDNARGRVIEHFCGQSAAAFTNGITELLLGPGAKLLHRRLHCEEGGAMHIGGVHARLGRDSHLDSFHLALGSDLKRIDIVIQHVGPGAHCDLNGLYLLSGSEHVDYHTTLEHEVPHCTSDIVFRGIIGDEASAVFNGRIHIHKDAQKTRAELSNKNLLTSKSAEINTKPELEIYADDVQCAHGATVAQLDEGMLHYLRTRGVGADEAEVMLSYGFINELVENLDSAALKDFIHPLLAQRLSRDPELIRHLV